MKTPYWIWQYAEWPHFCWNNDIIIASLARVREKQGRLLGLMDGLGFDVQWAGHHTVAFVVFANHGKCHQHCR